MKRKHHYRSCDIKNIMKITDKKFENSKEINKFPGGKNVLTKIKSRRTHLIGTTRDPE